MKFHFMLITWEELQIPDGPAADQLKAEVESGAITSSTEFFDRAYQIVPEKDIQQMRLIEFEEDAQIGHTITAPTKEIYSDDSELLWSDR